MSADVVPEHEYGLENGFYVSGFGPNYGMITPKEVWCEWCMCAIRPGVSFMRQHRHVCRADPRVTAPPAPDEIRG